MKFGEGDTDNRQNLASGSPDGKITFFFYMWCIKRADEVVLVDTGMTDKDMNDFGLRNQTRPTELLNQISVDPRNVKTIIISHLHADHFSAHNLYPKATFYIQTREVAFWATLPKSHSAFRASCRIAELIGLNYAGRVRFIDGEEEILSGICLVLVGGHTPGSQVIAVQTARGTAILTCDAVDFYENINDDIPSRAVTETAEDEAQSLVAFQTIRRLATSPDLIIPGHDPIIMDNFTNIAEGVVKIA